MFVCLTARRARLLTLAAGALLVAALSASLFAPELAEAALRSAAGGGGRRCRRL